MDLSIAPSQMTPNQIMPHENKAEEKFKARGTGHVKTESVVIIIKPQRNVTHWIRHKKLSHTVFGRHAFLLVL